MIIQENADLAPLTSFGVGGKADMLVTIESADDIAKAVDITKNQTVWRLGYGTNVLISDKGLPGVTLLFRNKSICFEENVAIAEAGAWWDDIVKQAVESELWGIEFMSGIPGSAGAAAFININAYGQSLADTLLWIEVYDSNTRKIIRLPSSELVWGYKKSIFQNPESSGLSILRLALKLSNQPTADLVYQSARDVADELGVDDSDLEGRRKIIIKARERAGSIFVHGQGHEKTVGSFFRNPVVTPDQAELVAKFDETGKSKDQIKKMSEVHGGSALRASAAHVLLASGFKRGQAWGPVRLHPKNLLKIENVGSATAQQIYNVAKEITNTVKQRLDITLEAEAQILGNFDD